MATVNGMRHATAGSPRDAARRRAPRARWSGARGLALAVLVATVSVLPLAAARAPLRVTVSISPYADIVARLGGELVSVSTLLPPGASPHSFDPTPSQAAGLARAELIVMNGGVDGWLARLVAATAPDVPTVVVMERVDVDPPGAGHGPGGEAEESYAGHAGHEHAGINPHVWLDPTLMLAAAEVVTEELARLDPANGGAYHAALGRLRADLLALDAEIAATLAPVRGAPFVPFHDAWPYFAERYGLDLVLSLEPFPGREPSPRYVAEAVAAVRAAGAKAVFAERQLDPRSAEVVAESAGVALATLDPIGGAPGPTDYESLLRFNAATILAALR